MSVLLAVLGALGGACAFITLCWITLKAIFKQVNATDKNTQATESLTDAITSLTQRVVNHETRITVLEDHDKRRRNGVRGTS